MTFELQRYEPNPHGHRENLLKNRTYQPMRWKGIIQTNDLDILTKARKKSNEYKLTEYRIINLDNLEVVG